MLPFLAMKAGQPVSVEVELTRDQLEQLIGALIRSTLEPIKTALKDASVDKAAITEVVLVGGSSRIPLVHQLLGEFFGKAPKGGINPDEAVALGAAVQAGLKSGAVSPATGIMITDVCPFTLGVETMSRTAGGEAVGGLFSPIIPRNSTIPVSRTEVYRTTADGQKAVEIRVFQGEDRLVRNNTFLDGYLVEGVPPSGAGVESVAITFTYDLNGILNVRTKIVSTGKEAALVVDKSARRLSPLERDEAKKRLEREWGPKPSAPGAPPRPSSPGGASPGGASPGGASPGGASPGGTSPGGASPGGTSPGGTSPGGRSPGGASPGGTSPGGASSGGAWASSSSAGVGATPTSSARAAATPAGADDILSVARAKLPRVDAATRGKLEAHIAQLESARAANDAAGAARADAALTELLFDLDG